MDIPVQIAVRLKPPSLADSTQCIFSNPVTQIVITESGQTFHVNRALPVDCSQANLFNSFMIPQINCFLDGCDTSVVVFGQPKTGKTYTLFGPGFECIHSESDQGIIPRFITDIFHKMNQLPEREFILHLTWMQVVNNNIFDVLGVGLVRCYSVEEAFQYLQLGWRQRCQGNHHTVFTVSMEQKWVGTNGVLNHRLSTASFCDLAAYPDPGLYALENIIKELLAGNPPKQINYDQCILTAMLKDSFGGRAFTWVIGCIGTEPEDYQETLQTLNLCLCCRGIKNFVTVNTFADNNTPVYAEKPIMPANDNNFNLQFATTQWIKLVSNAEGLFNKILQSKSLSEADISQVSEWLFLKAECDECLNTDIVVDNKDIGQKQGLPRIAEDTEPSERSESDEETDSEDSHSDTVFQDKLDKFMEYFREKNDHLFAERCEEYLNHIDSDDITISETSGSQSLPVLTSQSNSGRRRTIQPGESLSGPELELLRKVAAKAISPESQKIIIESHKKDVDPEPKLIERELLKMIDNPKTTEICKKYRITKEKYTQKQSLARKLSREISSSQTQLKELINLCISKEKTIDELARAIVNSQNRSHGDRVTSKHQYTKAKADLAAIKMKFDGEINNTKLEQQSNYFKSVIERYEKQLSDSVESSLIDQDTAKEIRKHETSIKTYKKRIEQIKRQIKKDEKRKNTLDVELVKDKMKLDELSETSIEVKDKKVNTLKHFTNRITQLDNILKEKTNDLENLDLSKERELMLRKEIKNLRKTRECLHEQRCSLGHKRKMYKSLSDSEERKLLECEEAIEAIDTAIEYKNNLICGKSPSASLSDSYGDGKDTRSRGEQMLMARLDKLSHDEIKTLLYRYFQKVVDLRGACAALEAAAAAAAGEAAAWRARAAAACRHAQRVKNAAHARHYNPMQRLLEGGHNYERALALGMTTDSETSDDAMRLVDRMRQLARYPPAPVIPSQNLRQLMPATPAPAATVTKQRNKLVIVQQNKRR
ncbi:kinesin-like protein costa [Plutella xylostella]|uniref:kinesin-like protein costa n=1 Tax=Plutella xylostella TaxID=51655 RepID=UPI002033055E|nr:kinesin-like protein costa [Plutella xylostella]